MTLFLFKKLLGGKDSGFVQEMNTPGNKNLAGGYPHNFLKTG